MTDISSSDDAVSRRRLFAGAAAAAAGAGALGSVLPGASVAAGAPPLRAPELAALGTQSSTLTYLPLDGLEFFPDTTGKSRLVDPTSGVQITPATPGSYLNANMPLPVGSVIRQINVAYQGQPVVVVGVRSMTTNPQTPGTFVSQSLAAGGGPKTQTLELNQPSGGLQPITVVAGATYLLRFFLGVGDSIYGASVGYTPPTQTFLPFSGGAPRILDTRESGGKFAAGEERTVALGFPGVRGAVMNLAITETVGAGFVAVYPANISYPGNASINWSASNQNISNGVITSVDANAAIKVRAGANATHVVIDRIGWFV